MTKSIADMDDDEFLDVVDEITEIRSWIQELIAAAGLPPMPESPSAT